MKTNLILPQLAILTVLLSSCLKNNDDFVAEESAVPEKLVNASATGRISANSTGDTTGFSGAAACYFTYFSTIENPPSSYIPGEAEINLNSCLAEHNGSLSNGGRPLRMLPPAPKTVLTQYPADPEGSTDPNSNNRRYLGFFNLTILHHPTAADSAAARETFERYCYLICDAIAENITFPDPSHIDKIAAGVTFATNHPDRFLSDDDRQNFLRFLSWVLASPSFPMAIGRRAIKTGLNNFSPAYNCIDMWFILLP